MRWLVAVLVLVGCGGDDDGSGVQGERGGVCYPNGTCNGTLSCINGVCWSYDGGLVDAPRDGQVVLIDAATACADDSSLEPNETYMTAWVTPVDTTMSFNLASLSICPTSADKDYYQIEISVGSRNLEVLIDSVGGGADITGAILNAGGIPIANTSTVSGMPRRQRAYTPSLPTGTYYVRAESLTGFGNYNLTINVTGP